MERETELDWMYAFLPQDPQWLGMSPFSHVPSQVRQAREQHGKLSAKTVGEKATNWPPAQCANLGESMDSQDITFIMAYRCVFNRVIDQCKMNWWAISYLTANMEMRVVEKK